jgi:hypothetical protein
MLPNTFIELKLRKKILLLSVTFLFMAASLAQKTSGNVKGILVDSISNEPISDATISIVEEKDSSFQSFTLSSKHGNFEIKKL